MGYLFLILALHDEKLCIFLCSTNFINHEFEILIEHAAKKNPKQVTRISRSSYPPPDRFLPLPLRIFRWPRFARHFTQREKEEGKRRGKRTKSLEREQ